MTNSMIQFFIFIIFIIILILILLVLNLLLSKIFKKRVEIELVKLRYPYHDSSILSQILGYNSNKYSFPRMLSIIVSKVAIKNPSLDILYSKEKIEEILESKYY